MTSSAEQGAFVDPGGALGEEILLRPGAGDGVAAAADQPRGEDGARGDDALTGDAGFDDLAVVDQQRADFADAGLGQPLRQADSPRP